MRRKSVFSVLAFIVSLSFAAISCASAPVAQDWQALEPPFVQAALADPPANMFQGIGNAVAGTDICLCV